MKMSDIFGKAVFVTSSEACVSPCFFGKFNAKKDAKTEIAICGLGFFRLFINGVRASSDVFAPVTSHYFSRENCYCTVQFGEIMKSRIYAVKYDISSLVRDGENEIEVSVGPGWYAEFSDKCVLCYKITSGDIETYSDKSIKWNDSPITDYSIHLGEKQDYTKHNYDKNGFSHDGLKNCDIADSLQTEYYLQDCPNDKVIRSLVPQKLYDDGEYSVYDIGENISGTYVFRAHDTGAKISVSVSEALDDGKFDEKHSHKQAAEFIADGKEREYSLTFTWHAFRYVRISSKAELLRVDVIHSDIAKTSDFKCENDVLNWLYDAYIRTQLCNMHAGIPSDCPHIERRGYTGDGQLTCEAVMLTTDSKKFYLKWMEDISDCQDVNSGHVQYTAPYFRCGGGPGGWGCAIAEVPYVFYKMYGDIEPMKKYYPQMMRYLDYLEAHSENDLVVSDQPGLWCLGEWCVPGAKQFAHPDIPAPFVNNYFYIRTIDRMTELAEKCGRADTVDALLKTRERKVRAIIDNYFNAETGDFCGNVNSANSFALDIGLGDERTFENLLNSVRTKPLDTGIFGTDLVTKLLFERGYFDDAIEFLSREKYPSFGFMMRSGATTLWEEWGNPRSMSHPMFGAVVKYLFYEILGIKRCGAGWENVVIAPKTNTTTGSVSGKITTEYGEICVDVDAQKNVCRVKISKKISAKVVFDGEIVIQN